jgi:hypothetical protein
VANALGSEPFDLAEYFLPIPAIQHASTTRMIYKCTRTRHASPLTTYRHTCRPALSHLHGYSEEAKVGTRHKGKRCSHLEIRQEGCAKYYENQGRSKRYSTICCPPTFAHTYIPVSVEAIKASQVKANAKKANAMSKGPKGMLTYSREPICAITLNFFFEGHVLAEISAARESLSTKGTATSTKDVQKSKKASDDKDAEIARLQGTSLLSVINL